LGISKFQNQKSGYMVSYDIVPYMEPKRILDLKFPYTKSSDIYSFGVLMWELYSRKKPFAEKEYNSLFAMEINKGLRESILDGTPEKYSNLYTSK
jgi:serine/threonine protein kinase